MIDELRNILVTGGFGFLGRHLVRSLCDTWFVNLDRKKRIAKVGDVYPVAQERCDLLNPVDVDREFSMVKPGTVFHLAARVGGIGANVDHPAAFWRDNLLMGINVLDACVKHRVKLLVLVGTTCSYPSRPKRIPFVERELFDGLPEPTNAPYGIAKRSLVAGAEAYRREYGLDTRVVVPTNLYGPGDNFDERTSHVIPALIRRFHEAKCARRDRVEVWGSGKATRDFLFVTDAANGIIAAADAVSLDGPVNLGTGREIRIVDAVKTIAKVVGYRGEIAFDRTKPDGQIRRCLDTTRAERLLRWEAERGFEEGIRETYAWYLKHLVSAA